ncbi:nitric oxide synthase oxygenase [Pararhizobium qamdonense]|uniref:nitric oxide synthase oxygenase n=1 Tax=Pararhizobium qamdonense TaxID=3031126 RepID=UPI0038B28513
MTHRNLKTRLGPRSSDHTRRSAAAPPQERTKDRKVYGHWPWIAPPLSSNLSNIWHDAHSKKKIVKPNFLSEQRHGCDLVRTMSAFKLDEPDFK